MEMSDLENKISLLSEEMKDELMEFVDFLLYKKQKKEISRMVKAEKVKQTKSLFDERDMNFR